MPPSLHRSDLSSHGALQRCNAVSVLPPARGPEARIRSEAPRPLSAKSRHAARCVLLISRPLRAVWRQCIIPTRSGALSRSRGKEGPVARLFLEALFTSLRDDLQVLKKDLSVDMREVRCYLEDIGNRVSAVEVCEARQDEEVQWAHQEVLHLQEQHIEIQAQAEDLENQSQKNYVHIREVLTHAEESDLREYIGALFQYIVGVTKDINLKPDRVHRVDPPRPEEAPLADMLTCAHDFQMKENILHKARDAHRVRFQDHIPVSYQDLSAITLQRH
ncbi:hypothetical protein NDU88_001654 [Pleurodeles waltl]|uniref:Uncharacterized protein n=1 Tax=Pleurodeles waltl TaxID=8319 RepID=A0AAV7MLL4_PLEWA|nr:hypothetical protein NDU88_001654 [Pleurodeles waltl]